MAPGPVNSFFTLNYHFDQCHQTTTVHQYVTLFLSQMRLIFGEDQNRVSMRAPIAVDIDASHLIQCRVISTATTVPDLISTIIDASISQPTLPNLGANIATSDCSISSQPTVDGNDRRKCKSPFL